jgi:predicted nucleic acid-binding protein
MGRLEEALLDTNASAELLRGDPGPARTLDELDTAHTSVVVIGELIHTSRGKVKEPAITICNMPKASYRMGWGPVVGIL